MRAIASRVFKIQDSYSGKVQIKQATETPYWYPQPIDFSRSREYQAAMTADPYTIPAYTRIKEEIAHNGGPLEISEFSLKAMIKAACMKASNSFNPLKVFNALVSSGLIQAEEVPENDTAPIPDKPKNDLKSDLKTSLKTDLKMQVETPQTQAHSDPIESRVYNLESRENITPLTPQAIQKRFADIGKGGGFVPPATQSAKRAANFETIIPDDWKPSEELTAWALEERPDVCPKIEAKCFYDWFKGEQKKHKNWDTTFKNWIRRARPTPAHLLKHSSDAQVSQMTQKQINRKYNLPEDFVLPKGHNPANYLPSGHPRRFGADGVETKEYEAVHY